MDNQINKSSGVFDMINNYAEQHNISNNDIFKSDAENKEVMTPIRKEMPKKTNDESTGEWVPDDSVLEGLTEMKRSTGVVLSKEELEEKSKPNELKNILDDKVSEHVADQMDEMDRAVYNIECSKTRLGIKHLNIPTIFNSRIMDAASDIDPVKAGQRLDDLISTITKQFPDAIVERIHIEEKEVNVTPDVNEIQPTMISAIHRDEPAVADDVVKAAVVTEPIVDGTIAESKIIIDKTNVPEISFTKEEVEKIKKSRSVTLNIIETKNMEYSIIEEDNSADSPLNIDAILKQYTRKMNDMRVSMPASKYRATFTGLSYPEILDLSYSQELNNLDGELKKWSIVFNHIKNPSIGDFKEYEYADATGNVIKVSAFEDFLKKTSFIDLEYALWAILCATCLDKEIVSIDCHGKNCNNVYDWIYDPKTLIQMSSVPVVTLEDMKITGELMDHDAIMEHYDGSMLKLANSVQLPSSGFILCFGHISAYDYLNSRLTDIVSVKESETAFISSLFEISCLTVIKYILLPDITSDKYRKIANGSDIMKVIHTLDELDCKAISELMDLMTDPYKFKFTLKDLSCPKCHTKSEINIDDMSTLLFLIAQSLNSSEVKLIRS
jgi:hypothetical protein